MPIAGILLIAAALTVLAGAAGGSGAIPAPATFWSGGNGQAGASRAYDDRAHPEEEKQDDEKRDGDDIADEDAADDVESDETVAEDGPERVVIHHSRDRYVGGYVELEDDDVIVIRTPAGKVESFSRSRVHKIVRLVDPEPEQRGVVVLRNGRTREGTIIEDHFDYVLMEIRGVRSRMRRDVVDHVILRPTFQQQYEQFRDSIRPGMHERHLALCRWLVEHREYELARQHLEELVEVHDSVEARRLLRVVSAQLALRMPRETQNEEAAPERPRRDEQQTPLISADDVNTIRVYEIDFSNPPRLAISPETIGRLIEQYSAHSAMPSGRAERNALYRRDPAEIARLMFELRAREFYSEIRVLNEPHSINQFRRHVHNTWLLNNCATSGCHGGPDAGIFRLNRGNLRDERVRYTNLLILERLEVHPDYPLINYDEPEVSLIIQYALPRSEARLPHPDVPGWKPIFTRRNDRGRRETIQWIKSMMQPRPEYPVDFDPNVLLRGDEAVAAQEDAREVEEDPQEVFPDERGERVPR